MLEAVTADRLKTGAELVGMYKPVLASEVSHQSRMTLGEETAGLLRLLLQLSAKLLVLQQLLLLEPRGAFPGVERLRGTKSVPVGGRLPQ